MVDIRNPDATALLIFDNSSFSLESFGRKYKRIDVFPLTADWEEIELVLRRLKEAGAKTSLLNSAISIDEEAQIYRDKFIEWAAAIGNFKVKSKTIRQHLLLSDKGVSAWWFGLLADKDPVKNPLFLRIVQTASILRKIQELRSDMVVLALRDPALQEKIRLILDAKSIKAETINYRSEKKDFLENVIGIVKRQILTRILLFLKETISSAAHLKRVMPPVKKRRIDFTQALLFFTYFPAISKPAAEQGRFRNRFVAPLQDICRQNKKTIVWVLSYANFDGYSFKDAVGLAKRFIANGEDMFFYLEFLDPKSTFKAFWEYLKIALVWKYLRNYLNHKTIDKLTGNDFSSPFILDVLDESFYGVYSLSGIIHYYAFKNLFKLLKGFSHGLYISEMMSWEYALLAAKKGSGVDMPFIGYEEFAFSPYYLQMFHSKEELKHKDTQGGIPMPETIACCGRVSQGMLQRYYGKVENLENLRYLYLSEQLKSKVRPTNRKSFVLFVCTNIDPNESRALINLIKVAYPNSEDGLEIWFKGHPNLQVKDLFKDLNIANEGKHYKIKEGATQDFLDQSDAVLVGASSVSIDALAFGCEVLVYLNSETLTLSPLVGFEEFYHKVYDPFSLRSVVDKLRSGERTTGVEKKHDFVRDYWNLNPSLNAWKKVLNLNS